MAAAAQMKIKSYLEKHKIGNLFEELYGHLLQDQPDDPLLYITRTLQRKVDQRKPRSSSPSRSKSLSSTMPAAPLSSSTDTAVEKPEKSEPIKLSSASKLKSKPNPVPSPSRNVAFASTPASSEPTAASAQSEAPFVSNVAATPSNLQISAPVVKKADAVPEKAPLDRELKPSGDKSNDSDESDLDDRLARLREDKLSRGKKASAAKDARKRELAEMLTKMKANAEASAPALLVAPAGPSASAETTPEENHEALEKELGVQSVKKIKKQKKPKKEKAPDVQVHVSLCARCASIIPEAELASGANGLHPPLWLSGEALIDDDFESASVLDGSHGPGNSTFTRQIPSASASPRNSALGQRREQPSSGTAGSRGPSSSNGRPATSGSTLPGGGGEGPESVGTSYAWQTVVDSDTESVSGSRSRSRGGTGTTGSRPTTAGSAIGHTGRF